MKRMAGTFSNCHLNIFHAYQTILYGVLLLLKSETKIVRIECVKDRKSKRVEYPAPFFEELPLSFSRYGMGLFPDLELGGGRVSVKLSLLLCYESSPSLLHHIELRHGRHQTLNHPFPFSFFLNIPALYNYLNNTIFSCLGFVILIIIFLLKLEFYDSFLISPYKLFFAVSYSS